FSVFLRIDVDRYPAFLFSGLLPWIWFATSLQQGVTCILDGAGFITRAQFPAEVLPVVTVTTNAANFLLSLPVLFVFLLAFRIELGWPLLVLPLLMAVEYLLVLGLVLVVCALDVYFRDMQHIILHVLTLVQFLIPI